MSWDALQLGVEGQSFNFDTIDDAALESLADSLNIPYPTSSHAELIHDGAGGRPELASDAGMGLSQSHHSHVMTPPPLPSPLHQHTSGLSMSLLPFPPLATIPDSSHFRPCAHSVSVGGAIQPPTRVPEPALQPPRPPPPSLPIEKQETMVVEQRKNQQPTSRSLVGSRQNTPAHSHLATNIKLTNQALVAFPDNLMTAGSQLHFLNLSRNRISTIPSQIAGFTSLVELHLGRNAIEVVPDEITLLTSLVRLDLSGNRIRKLPDNFHRLDRLQQLQLNGNNLHEIPVDVYRMSMLLKLYVGSNRIHEIRADISELRNLEVLYLGGNQLTELPKELGLLHNLTLLYLGDNQLSTLPQNIGHLISLRTLNLHNNKFKYLPEEIMRMKNLENLSLRGNPLIVDFVNTPIYQPLSLKELAGRAVKNYNINVDHSILPTDLKHFLDSARRCNNPRCAGVYFQSSVKNLQVVDFCGKFRVPLLKFLCEDKCKDASTPSYPPCTKNQSKSSTQCLKRMKRVLLDDYNYKCDCIACTNS